MISYYVFRCKVSVTLHVRIYRGLPTLYDLCGFLHPYLLAPDGVPSNEKRWPLLAAEPLIFFLDKLLLAWLLASHCVP